MNLYVGSNATSGLSSRRWHFSLDLQRAVLLIKQSQLVKYLVKYLVSLTEQLLDSVSAVGIRLILYLGWIQIHCVLVNIKLLQILVSHESTEQNGEGVLYLISKLLEIKEMWSSLSLVS